MIDMSLLQRGDAGEAHRFLDACATLGFCVVRNPALDVPQLLEHCEWLFSRSNGYKIDHLAMTRANTSGWYRYVGAHRNDVIESYTIGKDPSPAALREGYLVAACKFPADQLEGYFSSLANRWPPADAAGSDNRAVPFKADVLEWWHSCGGNGLGPPAGSGRCPVPTPHAFCFAASRR